MWRGTKTKLRLLTMTLMAGLSAPVSVSAASPEFARSTEEWSSLQNDVLEYEEIADLIHEYNVTVLNNRYEYQKFIKDYGRTKEDIANAYREVADELEAEISGDDSALAKVSNLQLEQQAKQLREQADNQLEDSEIYRLSYAQAEDNLVLSAQSKYISYYKSQLELESKRNEKRAAELSVSLARTKLQAGTATEAQVLDAQENVLELEKNISRSEQETERIRQELIISLGWTGSADPEIKGLPELDMAELDAIDTEADSQTARKTNYTMQMNQKKLEQTTGEDNRANLQNTIQGNQRQIEVSLTKAWEQLQSGRLFYEQAVLAAATEERNLTLARQKWEAGMITAYEYEQQQLTAENKKLSVKTAALDLLERLETYRWNVSGLAGA